MARPREFDEEDVLERAMEAFWARGYEATSLADLCEATGLAKGSLYKAFGDKRALFLRALDRYLDRGHRALVEAAAAGRGARETFERWLDGVAEMATRRLPRKGCFAVNAAIELAPHDPEVRRRLAAHQARQERVFREIVARGVATGELAAGLDPARAAQLVGTLVMGIQVGGRTTLDREAARGVVSLALGALGPPG